MEDTLDCLESLSHDTYSNKEIIIVDNGSSDDSVKEIRRLHPEAAILEMAGISASPAATTPASAMRSNGARLLYLLNNDTTVEPDALAELVAAAEAARNSVCSPRDPHLLPSA